MGINNENVYDMFHLPLSTIAHEELHNLEQEFTDLEITGDHDIWSFNWEVHTPQNEYTEN
jgi:hypothetical protein